MGKAANSSGNISYTNMCHLAPNCCLHITYRYWQKLWFKSHDFHMGHNQSHFLTLSFIHVQQLWLHSYHPQGHLKLQQEFNQFIALLCIIGFTLWNSITHKNTLTLYVKNNHQLHGWRFLNFRFCGECGLCAMISRLLSPWHGISSGCRWKSNLYMEGSHEYME